MLRILARTALALSLMSATTACHSSNPNLGAAIGAAAATVATHVAVAAIQHAIEGHKERAEDGRDHATAPARPETTCEKKRREWGYTHPSGMRPPPQLACGPDGEFAAPEVYGREAQIAADGDR
jgi:hypothetical protein